MEFYLPWLLLFLAAAVIYSIADYLLRGRIDFGYALIFSILPALAGMHLIFLRKGAVVALAGAIIVVASVFFGYVLMLKPTRQNR